MACHYQRLLRKLGYQPITEQQSTVHYLGDSFYPAIIDKETYQKAQEERKRRATKLGRNNKQTQMRTIQISTRFHMNEVSALHDNPMKQAEYLYSLIESESQ